MLNKWQHYARTLCQALMASSAFNPQHVSAELFTSQEHRCGKRNHSGLTDDPISPNKGNFTRWRRNKAPQERAARHVFESLEAAAPRLARSLQKARHEEEVMPSTAAALSSARPVCNAKRSSGVTTPRLFTLTAN